MELKERLKQDLTDYQSIPFWSWNDLLEPRELRRQIQEMKKAGIGGFFMHARGGLMTEYLGEDWFEATKACIDEAEKQGMHAWCYDENGWPSGFAGMKLLKDEKNWAHYLVCQRMTHFDPAALAVYTLEGASLCRAQGPRENTQEYIALFDRTNSSQVDILNPEIVRKFIDETHEKYYARFGDAFGRVMKGFFTDEPQYFRWDTAYSPLVLSEYQAIYGEDILDTLGALFIDCAQANRLRYRYWKLMNDLYTVNFAKQIYDWCTAHHCQLTGHTIAEESLYGQMLCSGGVMPFYQYEHKPGVDFLGRRILDEIMPRQVSSVAQQMGKKHVITETFACAGWDVTPRELKRIAEWQYVHGVNQMCQHLYPYSIRGQRKRDYPAFYSPHNTWTQPEEFRHFNDYFTALGYLLSESREMAPVAVIHPMHSAYFTYRHDDRHSCDALNSRFSALVEALGKAQIGHHYVDESLLAQHGRVEGKELILGECRYSCIVLPEMEGLDASTAAFLRKYTQNGGKLYLQGKAPHLVNGEEADLSFLKANISFEEMIPPEYALDRRDTAIRSTYRTAPFGRFLYAVNLSEDTAYSVRCTLKAKGARRFDPETRQDCPLYFESQGDGICVPLSLRPGESIVIFLDDDAAPAKKEASFPALQPLSLRAEIMETDENTLTLDTAALSYDGREYTAPMPIMALSDRLLRERKNRTVYLKYTFTAAEQLPSLRLESEKMAARNVWINGEMLAMTEPGSFDPAFVSADITDCVQYGVNEIVFEIQYAQSPSVYDIFNGVYYEHSDGTESLINCLSYETDIEAVYLRGRFSVRTGEMKKGPRNTLITGDGFALESPAASLSANAITEMGYPFFSGKMTLRFHFDAQGTERLLRLSGRYAIARVSINENEEKLLLFDDTLDISPFVHSGENTLDITLYSSCRNVFGPFHHAAEPEPLSVSPMTFARYGTWEKDGVSKAYSPDYAFVRFGLDAIEIG